MDKICRCPQCNQEFPNWWKMNSEMGSSDDDTIYFDYYCHCNCGCKFTYTEWYKLQCTTIEDDE